MAADLVQYIRDNRQRYTRGSIEATLREAGHDDATIAAAFAAAEAPDGASPSGLATFLAIVGILFALAVYGGTTFLGGLGALMSTSGPPTRTPIVLLLYTIGAAIVGIATCVFLWRARRRPANAALAVLGVAAASVVAWLALTGACLASWEGYTI